MASIFGSLGTSDPSATTLDPKRLFRVLPKVTGSKFKFPHDIQTEVWDAWFARRTEADLVLKMNTGSGKTVVGLVIAKSSLNEGVGPAVYLVPNLQLQEQVCETADELGIAWTNDPNDPVFGQSEAVLICTVQAMYNGKSKFGLEGSGKSINVGTVIVDDAHACIPIIEEKFSTVLDSSTNAYKKLFKKFSGVLKAQSLAGWTSIVAGERSQAVPVPYWAWVKELTDSYAALDGVTEQESKGHQFAWPLIKNQLNLCDVAFTGKEVEVRLPYPDLTVVPSFVNAQRRVYMTATLADDGVLITQMGVDEKCVVKPITPSSASDIGDRIILTPVETSRAVSEDDVKKSAVEWAKSHNVVVIVPSTFRADKWKPYTSEIHRADTIKAVVKRLNSGQHVGLVVLVARYDGLDLPGKACRVLIIDGLPERYSPQERVEAAAIGDTDAMSVQQTQRIEQGMGRGVRATDDYCAVILLDTRLVSRLYSAAHRQLLSPGTRAQYELSMEFAKVGRGESMSFFNDAVDGFLARDPQWTNASRKRVEGLTYTAASTVDALLVAQRDAYTHARAGRFKEAFGLLKAQFAGVSDARYRAWIKQRAASYLEQVDPAEARKVQSNARIDSRYILKVPSTQAAPKLTALGNQADAAAAFMASTYATTAELEVEVDAMLLDLTPSTAKNSHKRFEAALEKLGKLLGFNASRPDAETGIGPDDLWALGGNHYWVIECKSEAVVNEVSREYLEQLTHSADWFEGEYDQKMYTYTPILIHPSRVPMWDAVPRQNARAMTFEKLEEFRDAVKGFIGALCVNDAYRDAAAVGTNLRQFQLAASDLEQKWTQKFKAPAKR